MKILLAEDDSLFREAIYDSLNERGFDVTCTASGTEAISTLQNIQFDLVVSDIQMPGLSGVELLQRVRAGGVCADSKVPFILMTGFSMLLETKSAFEYGADEFITKPFKFLELFALINKIQNSHNKPDDKLEKEVSHPSKNFCKLAIEEFVSSSKFEYDVYIKLSAKKMLKIANRGEALDQNRIINYKAKGVTHLFVLAEDFHKIISFNLNIGKILQTRSDISDEKKLSFLKYTGEVLLEKVFVDQVDKELLEEASIFLKLTTDVLSESDPLFNLLDLLNNYSDVVYAHSVGVALYSVMLAKTLGFESTMAINKISMSALFHDIGKKELPKNLITKSRYLMSQEERALYETHVTRGKDILIATKATPSDVIQIIYEHHEDNAEQGFPSKVSRLKQHPLTYIVFAANLFVDQAMPIDGSSKKSGPEAIEFLEQTYYDRLDPKIIWALKKIFKL